MKIKFPFIPVSNWFKRFFNLLNYVLIGYISVMFFFHFGMALYALVTGYDEVAFAHMLGSAMQGFILMLILMFRGRDRFERRFMNDNLQLIDLLKSTEKILREQDELLNKMQELNDELVKGNDALKHAKASLEGKLKPLQVQEIKKGPGRPKKLIVNQ